MNNSIDDAQNRKNPSGSAELGGIKVRTQMVVLIGRIARFLVSITTLTLLFVALTYVLGLISF